MSAARPHGIRAIWPWAAALAAVVGIEVFAAPAIDPYLFSILIFAGINVTLAVSLNLVNGFTGQFSMGHAGFMSVGAYFSAWLTVMIQASHPEWLASPAFAVPVFGLVLASAGLAASAIGCLVGLPSLRLKGDYLAIVTLGFGEIIRVILLNIDAVGGARGLPNIPALSSFGWVYGVAVACVFAVWRTVHSARGREMLAVREDEVAAEAMGVDTTRAKVRAFVQGAFFAGIAGALFAHFLRYLNPAVFDFNRSFEIIIMVVLGGMGSITGSVAAALFLTGLREGLRELQQFTGQDYRMIIYALLLIVIMLTRPNGIFGTRELPEIFKTLGQKLRARRLSEKGAP